MQRIKIFLRIFLVVLALLIFAALIAWISYRLGYWHLHPRGNDSIGALFKLEFVLKFYPHINWVHGWAGGMALFTNYPSILFLILLLVYKINPMPTETLLSAAGVFSVLLGGVAVFWLVYFMAKRNWLIALASGIIYLITPSVYAVFGGGGMYPRGFAISLFLLTVTVAISFFYRLWHQKLRKIDYFLIIIFLSLTIVAHPTMGAISLGTITILWFFLNKNYLNSFKQFFKVGIFSFLLSLFYTLPFLLFPRWTPVPIGIYEKMKSQVLSWNKIFYFWGKIDLGVTNWRTLTPFLYPLAFLLFILLIILFCYILI